MILLDTCTLLWLSESPPRLPASVLAALRNTPPGQRYVAAITPFELGVKYYKKQLKLPTKPQVWFDHSCAERGLTCLPITRRIAQRAAALPTHHRDPADRLIISTALEHNLTVLTPDPQFRKYHRVRLSW